MSAFSSPIPNAKAYGGILLTSTGKVLLREPTNHWDGYVWTFAKGTPDSGESPVETALREVREETGYPVEIVDILPGVYHSGWGGSVYFVMRYTGEQGRTHWETHSTRWVDFDTAASLISTSSNVKGRARDLAVLAAAKAWFDANSTEFLPSSEEGVFTGAKKSDWETVDMPTQHVTLQLDFTLTADEAARVRLGFIPAEMEQKWFAYFDDNTLYQHRSWAGFCIDQIHFVPDGAGLRATHAEVNRDREQYGNTDDAEDVARIEHMVRHLARCKDHKPAPWAYKAFATALQPNYLGNPQVVAELFQPYFAVLFKEWSGKSLQADKLELAEHIARVMCEEGTGYTRMPSWHSESELGVNVVRYFGLNAEQYADQSLATILRAGLNAVEGAFMQLGKDYLAKGAAESSLSAQLDELGSYVVSVFMGTNMVSFQNKALTDFLLPAMPAESHQFANVAKLMAEIDALGKRVRFTFDEVRIAPGEVLTFRLDAAVTCIVDDCVGGVVYQGQKMSLSRAAVMALQAMGRKTQSARGPAYWAYQGELLVDRRDRLEDD